MNIVICIEDTNIGPRRGYGIMKWTGSTKEFLKHFYTEAEHRELEINKILL
tara:strand:- start:127286 stop:127438 length:153 start_codon:yes stop_codon:yes gene_type:complete